MARRRARGSVPEQEDSDPPVISTDVRRNSPGLIVKTLKVISTVALILYLLIPLILCLPPVTEQVLYLNLYLWEDEVQTLDQPATVYDLQGTTKFHVDCDEFKLGVWHVLPKELVATYKENDNSQHELKLKSAKNVIVYHHGAGTTRATGEFKQRAEIYKLFQSEGYHTIAFDYRGFGDSTGWPSESGLVNDSLCIQKWLRERVGSGTKVFSWGHSLGASIATLATKKIFENCDKNTNSCLKIDGLILEGGFTNVRKGAEDNSVVRLAMKLYPKIILMKGVDIGLQGTTLSTDTNIPMVRCPVMLLYAEDDDIIPSKHGDELFQICKNEMKHENKRVVFAKFKASHGYGHMKIYKAPEIPKLIGDFIEKKYGDKDFMTIDI